MNDDGAYVSWLTNMSSARKKSVRPFAGFLKIRINPV